MSEERISSDYVKYPMQAEDLRSAPLRIGVSTRALFNLEEENKIFDEQGVSAYSELQLERENVIIDKGSSFEVIERLLALNIKHSKPFVEVVLLSKNSPDLSLRAFNSIKHYGISIITGSFTSGRSLGPYKSAWNIDLFLSNDSGDVQAAIDAGTAAAKLGTAPTSWEETTQGEVRIAFDGDSVLFSPESDEVYKSKGLDAFLRHETDNALTPMNDGPFANFSRKLSKLRQIYMEENGVSKVRIAIVTARNAPAHARVIHTLRSWKIAADEAHFVGANNKTPMLAAFNAHIFFDDQEKHVSSAAGTVPSGHVPGPHHPDQPVIPANSTT